MTYTFKPKGVCSRSIEIELDGETIRAIRFEGGCSGNTQGVSALAVGMNAREYITRCKDIKCGTRSTSCPAQLAIAIQEALDAQKQ